MTCKLIIAKKNKVKTVRYELAAVSKNVRIVSRKVVIARNIVEILIVMPIVLVIL